MAPKGTKMPMKRPAAAVAEKASAAPVMKRSRIAGLSADMQSKCDQVSDALMLSEALPVHVREMLSSVLYKCLPTVTEHRHEYQHEVVEMVGEAFASIEEDYVKNIARFQATVDSSDADKKKIQESIDELEAESERCKLSSAEPKEQADAAAKSLDEAKAAVAAAKGEQAGVDKRLKQVEQKKTTLESALKNIFVPMKEGKVNAKDKLKQLKTLEKIVKEFIEASLWMSLNSTLKKEESQRGDFGKLVIQQTEEGFAAQIAKLAAEVEEHVASKEEFAKVVSAREAAAEAAAAKASASQDVYRKSTAAVAECAQRIADKKKEMSNYFVELKKAGDDLDRTRALFEKFKVGALKTCKELASAQGVCDAESKQEEPNDKEVLPSSDSKLAEDDSACGVDESLVTATEE